MIQVPGVYIAQVLRTTPPPEPCTLVCCAGHCYRGTKDEVGTRCRICIGEAREHWQLAVTQTRRFFL